MAAADPFLERTATLRAPIPGGSPGGTDVTFDPAFEKVKGEMDKMTSMAGTPPNWGDVIDVGGLILSSKAKDMRVAAWFTVAKMQRQGWDGFAEGLCVLRSMVADHWDVMFPEVKRGRARANLVTWLAEQSATYFDPRDVTVQDADAVKASDEVLNEMDGVLSEKLGDLYPGLGKLRATLRDKVRSIPAEVPPPPPPGSAASAGSTQETRETTGSSASATGGPAVSLPSMPSSPEEAVSTVRECGGVLMNVAKMLRAADPAQPWSYRLHRLGAWIAVQQAPPAEGGRTRLPPPAPELKRKVGQLVETQKWLDLLNVAEDGTATYRFWFDLHRLVAMAMDNLGALFLGPREVLGREIVAFVERFPTVQTLAFSDGTPFADPATKSWLDAERKRWGATGGAGGGNAALNEEDEDLNRRFEEARSLVTSGKAGEGLALAVQLASRGPDARTRFRSRLNVAKLAIDGGKPEVARPILEGLMAEVEQHALEAWEPAMCATLYAALLSCLQVPGPAGKPAAADLAIRQALIYDKLCRLDPAAALRLSS